MTEPDFSGKLSFSKKWVKRAQKGFFARNEASYGWLTFCANPISGKTHILDIYVQKLSTNQIARFFKLLSFEPLTVFGHTLWGPMNSVSSVSQSVSLSVRKVTIFSAAGQSNKGFQSD